MSNYNRNKILFIHSILRMKVHFMSHFMIKYVLALNLQIKLEGIMYNITVKIQIIKGNIFPLTTQDFLNILNEIYNTYKN